VMSAGVNLGLTSPAAQVRSRGHEPTSTLILVLLRRIDRELSDELVLLIEDAHLTPSQHHDYPTASVGATDAEIEEETAVAQADLARGVDLVVADPIALDENSGLEGSSLGAVPEGRGWRASLDSAVRPDIVGVLNIWPTPPKAAGLAHYHAPSVTRRSGLHQGPEPWLSLFAAFSQLRCGTFASRASSAFRSRAPSSACIRRAIEGTELLSVLNSRLDKART
jgi:hypothetical protein